jgi:hypothetical protein
VRCIEDAKKRETPGKRLDKTVTAHGRKRADG